MIRDLMIVTGTGSLFYGLWQVSQPVAYIVAGVALLVLAVVSYKGRGKPPRQHGRG